jgi:hypothetical protein
MGDIPDDIVAAARKAVWDTGRGMIGREKDYLEYRVQRAILAERVRCVGPVKTSTRMLEALKEAGAFILAPPEDLKESVLYRIRVAIAEAGGRP